MKTPRLHLTRPLSAFVALVLLTTYGFWTLNQPLPLLRPSNATTNFQIKANPSALQWPSAQTAVGIVGTPILEKQGEQKALPTASTAKIITALTVLKQKPLAADQQGPTITLNSADVDIYNRYVAQNGSVVPVQAGEQISQYQMLQAIMLPSANNIADSLAIWAYGSLGAYATAANSYMTQLGLKDTHIGSDASGLAPDSVSTAQDLVKLGELAMQHPVLAQIVGQTTATGIPLTTSVKNVNSLLGTANIVGLKTGNSDEAGGVFVSASKTTVTGKPVTIVTAVIGTPDLFSALQTSLSLVRSAQSNFGSRPIITNTKNALGAYKLPWGGAVTAVASKNFSVQAWNETTVKAQVQLDPIAAHTKAGQPVGKVTVNTTLVKQASIPVVIKTEIPQPTTWWRLTHPIR